MAITIWIDRGSLTSAILNGLILFIVIIIQTVHRMKEMEKFSFGTSIFNLSAVLSILFCSAMGILRLLSLFGIYTDCDYHCTLYVELGAFFWLSMKLWMYICFITRLDVAFRDSMFEFSHKVFTFLYLLIIIAYITQLSLYIILGEGTYDVDEDDIPFCVSIIPIWLRLYALVCDAVISTLLSILFIRRLFQAFIMSRQHNNHHFVESELSKIAQYITLSIIGVLSTSIALILLSTTKWFVWMYLDLIVNCWCIFLIFRVNNRWFNVVCCVCHKCVGLSLYKIMEWNHVFDAEDRLDHKSVDFKQASIDNKNLAVLTRYSFRSIYDINNEYNRVKREKQEESNSDLSEQQDEHTATDETIINLAEPELIAINTESKSD